MQSVPLNSVIPLDIPLHNASGNAIAADELPKFYIFAGASVIPTYTGALVQRANFPIYYLEAPISGVNGFVANTHYNLVVSGKVENRVGFDTRLSFQVVPADFNPGVGYIPVNVIRVTGSVVIPTDVVSANITHISGQPVNLQAVQTIPSGQFPYFCEVRIERDTSNLTDEYTGTWYRNALMVPSGEIITPTIQVIRRSNGTNLIGLAGPSGMVHISPSLGAVKYDEKTNFITAGEPYIVLLSATIDGLNHSWPKIIGRDG